MKTMKKLLSIAMVLTLVLALGVSALADTTVTINDDDTNSTYTAYQLLTAVYQKTEADNKDVYIYHINETFLDAINDGLTNCPGEVTYNKKVVQKPVYAGNLDAFEKNLMEYLSGLSENATPAADAQNTGSIRTFADAVYAAIKADPTMSAAGKSFEGKTATLPDGYYLITETVGAAGEGETSGVTSLVMLDTAGHGALTVDVKEDVPSSKKKIQDRNDTNGTQTGWQDSADWDIGDPIPYQLSATLNNTHYSEYEHYYLQFVDDMSAGLDAPTGTRIYWVAAGDTQQHDITSAFTGPTKVTEPASNYKNGSVYTWTCYDIKAAGVPAFATVYVEYSAVLNEGAVIGSEGNPNRMHIEFSNNPYNTGDGKTTPGDTGHTPWDTVIAFTYDLDVNKVNGNNAELDGAGFALLKEIAAEDVPADVAKGEWSALSGSGLTVGSYYTKNGATYKIVGLITDANAKAEFYFKGVDDGHYFLVETEVPYGYNKAEDVEFYVVAKHSGSTDGTSLEDDAPHFEGLDVTDKDGKTLAGTDETASFKVFNDASKNMLVTDVMNLTGLELPSTGGIGTTIFYVVGAILVAGAIILLVTKRRVNGANK